MSEVAEKKKATKEVATAVTETGISVNLKSLSKEEAAKALSEMKQGEEISGYLNFSPGETKKVVFLGWGEIQAISRPKGEMTKCVKLLTDSGNEQINADAVIISTFEKMQEGAAVQITCTGEKNGEKGTYKSFKFHNLEK